MGERLRCLHLFRDSRNLSQLCLSLLDDERHPNQVTGGFCALLGVFIMTLPIPIVVNSFASYYKNRLWRNEVSMKKRERIREQVGSKTLETYKVTK